MMKKVFIIAAMLILAGGILFTVALAQNNWSFLELDAREFETCSYDINEEIRDIMIDVDTADIILQPSENEECKVECYQEKGLEFSVDFEDGLLRIKSHEKKWHDHITVFSFKYPKITIYLPLSQYDNLDINSSTGDLKIRGIDFTIINSSGSTGDVKFNDLKADNIKIKRSTGDINLNSVQCDGKLDIGVTTGDVKLVDVNCGEFSTDGSTGDVFVENVIALDSLFIKRSTGDIKLRDSDASEIKIETSTGRVSGTILTEKVFVANSSTGYIKVPSTSSGGKCEIKTSTGDINIKLSGQ